MRTSVTARSAVTWLLLYALLAAVGPQVGNGFSESTPAPLVQNSRHATISKLLRSPGQEAVLVVAEQSSKTLSINMGKGYVSGRFSVEKPLMPLVVANPNAIKLNILAESGVSRVISEQTEYFDEAGTSKALIAGSEAELHIFQRDRSYYVKVVPLALGRCEVNIIIFFADGGISSEKTLFATVPPQDKPVALVVSNSGVHNVTTIYMEHTGELKMRENRNRISLHAKYDGMEQEIHIPASYVTFDVKDSTVPPAISVDATGYIVTNHTGHSLVRSSYGGMSRFTCVVVSKLGGNVTGREPCWDLLKSGETIER